MVGTFASFYALWRVTDTTGHVMREWDDEPGDMSDEIEAELVALDLISNQPETQGYADIFGPPATSTAVAFHTLFL